MPNITSKFKDIVVPGISVKDNLHQLGGNKVQQNEIPMEDSIIFKSSMNLPDEEQEKLQTKMFPPKNDINFESNDGMKTFEEDILDNLAIFEGKKLKNNFEQSLSSNKDKPEQIQQNRLTSDKWKFDDNFQDYLTPKVKIIIPT